jgi:hypothetical protein
MIATTIKSSISENPLELRFIYSSLNYSMTPGETRTRRHMLYVQVISQLLVNEKIVTTYKPLVISELVFWDTKLADVARNDGRVSPKFVKRHDNYCPNHPLILP